MERVAFTEHRGKKILFLDFTGLLPEELGAVVERARGLIDEQPPKSLLTLTKVDGARFNGDTVSLLKDFARANEPFVRKGAIVGLEGLQKLVLETVAKFTRRKFYVCADLQEARERLAADD